MRAIGVGDRVEEGFSLHPNGGLTGCLASTSRAPTKRRFRDPRFLQYLLGTGPPRQAPHARRGRWTRRQAPIYVLAVRWRVCTIGFWRRLSHARNLVLVRTLPRWDNRTGRKALKTGPKTACMRHYRREILNARNLESSSYSLKATPHETL